MFLSEKIKEMNAMGRTVADVNKFKDAYSEKIQQGAPANEAMEHAEKVTPQPAKKDGAK